MANRHERLFRWLGRRTSDQIEVAASDGAKGYLSSIKQHAKNVALDYVILLVTRDGPLSGQFLSNVTQNDGAESFSLAPAAKKIL